MAKDQSISVESVTQQHRHSSVLTENAVPNGSVKRQSKSRQRRNKCTRLSLMTIQEQFDTAVEIIKNLPKSSSFQPSDQMKLKFYGFYKQAVDGPNNTSKPSFYDIVNRYKWDAWSKLGNMSKEDAMKFYVNELKQVIESIPFDNSMCETYNKLGPFADLIQKDIASISGQTQSNGNNGHDGLDANFSSSDDSNSDDDFSDTVDSLSTNGDFKTNSCSNDSGFASKNHDFDNKNDFEDCTDSNASFEPSDLIEAKGNDADQSNGQENYFYDCIDQNAVLSPNDIICARGETGIFSSRINLPANQEQSVSRNSRQTQNQGTMYRSSDEMYSQGSGGSGGDRNFNNPNSELIDIHEHLALTVLRLQQTVKSISNRIESLETKLSERQSELVRKDDKKRTSWWPSSSTQTTVLLILWPFAAHLIVTAVKKKINNK